MAVVAVAACAEQPPSNVTATPATPRAAPATADDILATMAQVYATTPTYTDHGTVTVVFTPVDREPNTTTLKFETAFVRSQRFRFEYRKDHEFRGKVLGSQDYVIWSDFVHTYSAWSVTKGIQDDGQNLGLALAAAAGVSDTSSVNIPSLLMPGLAPATYARLAAPSLDGTETVDGHACWRITGKRRGDSMTVWIDRETHVVRRADTRHHFDGFEAAQSIVFEPILGSALDPATLLAPDITATPPTPRARPKTRAWLGIRPTNQTTTIGAVVHGGPADRAGMQAGDRVVAIDGVAIRSFADLWKRLFDIDAGRAVVVTVERAGTQVEIHLTGETVPSPLELAKAQLLDKPAPAFDLPRIDSAAHVTNAPGAVTLVQFLSVDSGPCAGQVAVLEDLARKHPTLRILAISSDDPDDLRQFVRDNHVTYAVAADAGAITAGAYSATSYPMVVVVDSAGVVRAVVGDNGDELAAVVTRVLAGT